MAAMKRASTAFRFGIPQILQVTLIAAVILLLAKLFPVPRSYLAIGLFDLLIAAAVWTSRSRPYQGAEDTDVQRMMGRSSLGRKAWNQAQTRRRNRLGSAAALAAAFALLSWYHNVSPVMFHEHTLTWELGAWLMQIVLGVQICRLDLTPDDIPSAKLSYRLTSRAVGADVRPADESRPRPQLTTDDGDKTGE